MAGVIDDHARVLAAVQSLVDGMRPDQMSGPTPCDQWDVRALTNHIVGGEARFAAMARGEPPPARETDFVGDDPSAALRSAGAALERVFSQRGMLERTLPSPAGEHPGELLVHMRVNELLVHGWDLARATRQSVRGLPDDLAERALGMWRARLAGMPRGPGGPFGPEQPVRDDAPATERLAAYLGRDVS